MPGLLKFWGSQNNSLRATDISAYAREPVAWQCEYGHKFERPPYRVLATGHQCRECRREGKIPWCIGGKADGTATLPEAFPEIASEWDYELNLRSPQEFAPGSQRVACWRCPNGHSWSSPICHRTSAARHPASCQQCKAIAFSAPELAAQLHPTLNPPGIAEKVRKGSSEVLFWQCELGHIFSAAVSARLRRTYPASCDKCRSIAVKAPELIEACWAFELNGQHDPEVLTSSNSQEVWWVRVDRLHIKPAKRQAEHFERKRIGYRYRRYINNTQREIAPVREFLSDQKHRTVTEAAAAATAKRRRKA
ncbi:MAG: hypothetical protein ACI87W_002016 [Halieaceae bacterium]|jgi:hypothetical protein